MSKSIIYGKSLKHWMPSFFTKNGKHDIVMFRGVFHGYGPTCQLHIRPKMKDVLRFTMIYDVALCDSVFKSHIFGS